MKKEVEEKVFYNWTVREMIGKGAFGTVYRIEREEFGTLYQAAMKKIMIPQSAEDIEEAIDEGMDTQSVTSYFRGFVDEIVNEFRLMAQLKGHTNIVSYEDHMVIPHADGIGWDIMIRMELLKSLKSAEVKQNMTEEEVIKLGIDICSALDVCGKMNIIHRDIKPENIFVTSFGEYKLGDFGIARTAEKTMSSLSKKGTYTYMAPEVYKGEKYNATADIYSLGIVMYRFMNNNRTPFLPLYPQPISFSDREASLTKRISDAPMPMPANGSKELKRIILKACAYRASERYQSPSEMKSELEKLLVAPQMRGQTETPSVREEGEMTAWTGEMQDEDSDEDTTVSIFAQTEGRIPHEVPPAAPQPEPEKPNKKTGIYVSMVVAVVAVVCIGIGVAFSGGGGSAASADSEGLSAASAVGVSDPMNGETPDVDQLSKTVDGEVLDTDQTADFGVDGELDEVTRQAMKTKLTEMVAAIEEEQNALGVANMLFEVPLVDRTDGRYAVYTFMDTDFFAEGSYEFLGDEEFDLALQVFNNVFCQYGGVELYGRYIDMISICAYRDIEPDSGAYSDAQQNWLCEERSDEIYRYCNEKYTDLCYYYNLSPTGLSSTDLIYNTNGEVVFDTRRKVSFFILLEPDAF